MAGKVVHCKKEPFDVYVGRGRNSVWGNPFQIGPDGDRAEVIRKYKEWITRGEGRPLLKRLGELEGKTLGCWCTGYGGLTAGDEPMICHGQVLLKLVAYRRELIEKKKAHQHGGG